VLSPSGSSHCLNSAKIITSPRKGCSYIFNSCLRTPASSLGGGEAPLRLAWNEVLFLFAVVVEVKPPPARNGGSGQTPHEFYGSRNITVAPYVAF
jgi:hypothetical protein